MIEIGIRALKQNASAVVAQVAAGDVLTVTDRGRPVAQITPIVNSRLAAMRDARRVRPARMPFVDLPAPLPGPGLSDELQQQRSEERY